MVIKIERIFYWILVLALGILLLRLQYCSGRKPCPTITQQVVHDTVNRVDSFSTAKPKPVSRKKQMTLQSQVGFFTIDSFNTRLDTSLTLTSYEYSKLTDTFWYSNKYPFKYGNVIVNSQVASNELVDQKVIINSKIIDSTVYIKQVDTLYKEKKKTILYIGGGMYGNKETYLRGGMIGLSLKTRNDKIYSIGRIQHFGINEGYWFGEIKLPIKLKFKK